MKRILWNMMREEQIRQTHQTTGYERRGAAYLMLNTWDRWLFILCTFEVFLLVKSSAERLREYLIWKGGGTRMDQIEIKGKVNTPYQIMDGNVYKIKELIVK